MAVRMTEEEGDAEGLKALHRRLTQRTSLLRCPEHGTAPEIKLIGDELLFPSQCCDQLSELVHRMVAKETR
jgi:hypothetical protein